MHFVPTAGDKRDRISNKPQLHLVTMSVNTSSLLSSVAAKVNWKMARGTSKMNVVVPSSIAITSKHNPSSIAGQLTAW